MKIYKCSICGNIAMKIVDMGPNLVCCNKEMDLLSVNTEDGLGEKHVPVVNIKESEVEIIVGDVIHPMEDSHYIMFIVLETTNGFRVTYLNPQDEPKANFTLAEGERVIAAYEYCNLHGLWAKQF